MSHHNVIVVGGGQAGLSASYYLQQRDINHLVLESRTLTHTGASSAGTASPWSRPTGSARSPVLPTGGPSRMAS
ncbi:FAD-dependent oxidoreductase [Cystobacter fuscus]